VKEYDVGFGISPRCDELNIFGFESIFSAAAENVDKP
jgi:hypothetical protein